MSMCSDSRRDPATGEDEIAARVLAGDVRAVARLITAIENASPQARRLMSPLFRHTGKAYVVGVTGAPGAGKSTLVDGLIRVARAEDCTVAVLAVDPSSPFSGGAVLGDRIRMQAHASDPGVFIRSMSTRGHLGGLAQAARDAVRVLDAAGYELILVETVGVGQSELDIAGAADATLVVVTPGMGDGVQTLKAGILEIADVFALNKADQDGAAHMLRALNSMLHMHAGSDKHVEVVQTRAHEGGGIQALWSALLQYRSRIEASGDLHTRRSSRLRGEVRGLVDRGLRTTMAPRLLALPRSETVMQTVLDRVIDPATGADAILRLADAASRDPHASGAADAETVGMVPNLPY